MALSLRDIAYAVLAVACFTVSAQVIDRVAYGVEMAKRGLASHQFEGNR